MALRVGSSLPSFEGATQWIGKETSLDSLSGYACLVNFWAVSCPFCLMNIPTLRKWEDSYADSGLRFVSVHLPRVSSDYNVESVQKSIEQHYIVGHCALDNERVIGNRFETSGVWPYYFLFDFEGNLRNRAAGDVGLRLLENTLNRVMSNRTQSMVYKEKK